MDGRVLNAQAGQVMANEQQRRDFGEALFDEREAAGLSQAALGAAVNKTGSAVGQWEAGITEPDPDTVFALEETLPVPSGRLSVHLGYVKANVGGPVDVIAALKRDERITDDRIRRMLINFYRDAVT